MNKEIKEILYDLGNKDNYHIDEFAFYYKRINLYDSLQLIDYIKNLYKENEKLKYFINNLISKLKHCELNKTKELDIVSDYIKQEYEKLLKGGFQ